jgi:hypothetical protein
MTFWCLGTPEKLSGYGARADWDESMDSEQIICPLSEGHMRGGDRIGKLAVTLPSPRVGDLIWTWGSTECLVRDHVVSRFKEAGFTGFETAPVTVTEVGGRRDARPQGGDADAQPPRLWEFVVTGWAGEAADESGIRLTEYCEGCKSLTYSAATRPERLIEEAQWDGSDFFIVWPLPKFIFVTERVAELIRAERYTGCQLVRPGDLDLTGGFGPGEPPPGRQVRGPEAFPDAEVMRFPPQ